MVDANLLIYDRFRFAAAPSGADLTRTYALRHGCAGLPWIAILALIRITTRAGIMRRPLSPPVALAYLQSWLEQPCVEAVVSGEHHRAILRRLLEATGVAGNLASDAHLGALALERGAYVSSADHEFARFPGSTHVDPMAR